MATKPKTTGRQQRKNSKTAQARLPALARFYRYKLPAIVPGDFTFHLDLLRPRQPAISLDRMVDTLSWDDEQSVLTGSITAYRPDRDDPTKLPIARGHLVRCRVKWGSSTYQLWTMRVGGSQDAGTNSGPQVQVDTGQLTIPLVDDMALLDSGSRDWWFRKTKRRPHGYTADEIAREVARTAGVRIRKAAKGTHRMELKLKGVSALAVLQRAYQNEKDHAGRKFVIRMRNGQLEIVPFARNPLIYVLGPLIKTALITQKNGAKAPTTVLTGRGHIGKGRGARPVSATVFDRKVVKQLGYVHDTKDFGQVSSVADLRGKAQRELAARLRLNDTITIEAPGIPFILRGDGVELALPKEGYSGDNAFVYCIRANHSVQAGTYTATWDFNATDPFLGDAASKAASPKKAAKKAASKRAAKRLVRPRPKLRR